MGHGAYSREAHDQILQNRRGLSAEQVFARTACHPLMNPKGVLVRESRDSADHPSSLGIAFALDVTGSMGMIPKELATKTLPQFMNLLLGTGVADPQVLFMAVGDATSDSAPLQVGQFESTAPLMDQWLVWSYREGGGGGTGSESYELALYFLAAHTEMDCWVKRRKRGYCLLTGDELPYPVLSRSIVEGIHGDRLDDDLKVEEIVAELQTTFRPFFLVPSPDRRARCERRRELLGPTCSAWKSPATLVVAASVVALSEGKVSDLSALRTVLAAANTPPEQIGRATHALRPWFEAQRDPSTAVPGSEPGAPSLLRRLFGRS
jgi:hypothetical protein